MRTRLWGWRGLLLLSSILGIMVLVALGLRFNLFWGVAGGSLVSLAMNVIFNLKTMREWAQETLRASRIGWNEMKLKQLERQERIRLLIELEDIQRNKIDSYLRTHVESVSYKGLARTPPRIVLEVKFLNFSIFNWRINSCALNLDFPLDTYPIICRQHGYGLRGQATTLLKSTTVERCQPANVSILLDIESSLADCLREAVPSSEFVSYRIPIVWQLQADDETIGLHCYSDFLSHDHTPREES